MLYSIGILAMNIFYIYICSVINEVWNLLWEMNSWVSVIKCSNKRIRIWMVSRWGYLRIVEGMMELVRWYL